MFQKLTSRYAKRIGCSSKSLASEISSLVEGVSENLLVTYRVKSEETLRKKMKLKGVCSISSIDDVYGFRVLVATEEEAYKVLHLVREHFQGFIDHDYIAVPKKKLSRPGKELRLIQYIAKRNGVTFEIQITTHLYNEANELLHEEYHRRKYE